MKVIWKYALYNVGFTELYLPEAANILDIQLQGNTITLWAEVNPEEGWENRFFYTAYTGESLPSNDLIYIGTVQQGSLVCHIYESLKKKEEETDG